MRYITLGSGHRAKIDDDSYDELSAYKWSFIRAKYGCYAVRYAPITHKTIYMHREIARPSARMQVDHINGDKLDNRKSNLRVCTFSENIANRGPNKNNRSGYKGVHKHVINGRIFWVVNMVDKIDGEYKRVYSKHHSDIIIAAKDYNRVAYARWGEFAYLNKV